MSDGEEKKTGAGEITVLLRGAASGPGSADRLWERVYPELRKRAARLVRGERSDHTLSATAVVNEAFVRLSAKEAGDWDDRSHFYAVASSIMRHVLIDHARARGAAKRGSGQTLQELDESVFPAVAEDEAGFREAERALEVLAQDHERAALVVALRVFGGLTMSEIAAEVGVAERTAKSDWALARERLADILAPDQNERL